MSERLPDDITAAIRDLESCAWVDGNLETAAASHGRVVARAAVEAAILKLADENARLREEWAQEGIGWLRDKDIDCLMGVEDENKRLTAENGRLRKGIQDMLDGNYPHPRSYRPGKCAHDVWYFDECPSCDEAHLQAILNLGGGFNEQATANSDAGHSNER